MFGGERFDRLINVFGKFDMAATGFAMGDITLLEFLRGWNLLPNFPATAKVLVTRFPNETPELEQYSMKVAQDLRTAGLNVDLYPTADKLDKQLKYADKKGIPFVIIAGEDEMNKGIVKVKNLQKMEQREVKTKELTTTLLNS
jgi:histidyl-tRNA synthetase